MTERHLAVALLAERQGGVVALWQLLELGFSRNVVQRWLTGRRLHGLYPGVYAVGHRAVAWKGRLMAAVLACGSDAVLSHRSAGAWWAILPSERAVVDVSAPGRHRLRGVDAHVMRIDERDRTEHDDLPVTSVARTLLDLAEVVPPRRLAKAAESAERMHLFDRRAVDDVLTRSPGRHGLKPLRILLSNYRSGQMTRSELEIAFLEFVDQEQLPKPRANGLVGIYEVDMLWEQQRVIVELDSWEYHRTREAFERDRERDIELQLAGYAVIRVTERVLTQHRARLVSQLTTLLGHP